MDDICDNCADDYNFVAERMQKYRKLANDRLVMLKRLEWKRYGYYSVCVVCAGQDRHFSTCELAALLEEEE